MVRIKRARSWKILPVLCVLTLSGCQSCGEAERQAAEAAAQAEEEAARAAEEAEARAAAEAEAAAAAERAAAEAEAAAAAEREAARRHTVVRGDCLWCIAEERWGDGGRWREIYEANSNQIDDPDLIYPGQVLTLPTA